MARAVAGAGAAVILTDLDAKRAAAVGFEIGARVVAPDSILEVECDVLAPCAVGRVIDRKAAAKIRAWAVCGAANDILADEGTAEALRARGILHVPDPIASAGAVIEGIGRTVMGLADRTPLIDRLGVTAREVLAEARARGATPVSIAYERAAALLGPPRG